MTDKMFYATAWALFFVVWILLGMVFGKRAARSFFLKTLWGINFSLVSAIYVFGIMPHVDLIGSLVLFCALIAAFVLQVRIFRKGREKGETK
jgi:predicted permease